MSNIKILFCIIAIFKYQMKVFNMPKIILIRNDVYLKIREHALLLDIKVTIEDKLTGHCFVISWYKSDDGYERPLFLKNVHLK